MDKKEVENLLDEYNAQNSQEQTIIDTANDGCCMDLSDLCCLASCDVCCDELCV